MVFDITKEEDKICLTISFKEVSSCLCDDFKKTVCLFTIKHFLEDNNVNFLIDKIYLNALIRSLPSKNGEVWFNISVDIYNNPVLEVEMRYDNNVKHFCL